MKNSWCSLVSPFVVLSSFLTKNEYSIYHKYIRYLNISNIHKETGWQERELYVSEKWRVSIRRNISQSVLKFNIYLFGRESIEYPDLKQTLHYFLFLDSCNAFLTCDNSLFVFGDPTFLKTKNVLAQQQGSATRATLWCMLHKGEQIFRMLK